MGIVLMEHKESEGGVGEMVYLRAANMFYEHQGSVVEHPMSYSFLLSLLGSVSAIACQLVDRVQLLETPE